MRPVGLEVASYIRGHIMANLGDIDLDLIDFLIEIEKQRQKEQSEDEKRPFLQLPVEKPPFWEEKDQKSEKNDENDIIEIDI